MRPVPHPKFRQIETIELHADAGLPGDLQLILKHCRSNEPPALDALSRVPLPPGRVPERVTSGAPLRGYDGTWFADRHWLIYVKVPGEPHRHGMKSDLVFDTFARIHAFYYENVDSLHALEHFDSAQWRAMCAEVAEKLDQARAHIQDRRVEWMREQVALRCLTWV